MKRNGIIYPNTPFFRKYAGKIIMPMGAEGATGFYAKQTEGNVFYMISPDDFSGSFSLVYDGNELAIDDDYYIGEASQIPSEEIEEIKAFFDIDIDITGWYLSYVGITNVELITAGDHTVTATYNGQSVTFTMTIE